MQLGYVARVCVCVWLARGRLCGEKASQHLDVFKATVELSAAAASPWADPREECLPGLPAAASETTA